MLEAKTKQTDLGIKDLNTKLAAAEARARVTLLWKSRAEIATLS